MANERIPGVKELFAGSGVRVSRGTGAAARAFTSSKDPHTWDEARTRLQGEGVDTRGLRARVERAPMEGTRFRWWAAVTGRGAASKRFADIERELLDMSLPTPRGSAEIEEVSEDGERVIVRGTWRSEYTIAPGPEPEIQRAVEATLRSAGLHGLAVSAVMPGSVPVSSSSSSAIEERAPYASEEAARLLRVIGRHRMKRAAHLEYGTKQTPLQVGDVLTPISMVPNGEVQAVLWRRDSDGVKGFAFPDSWGDFPRGYAERIAVEERAPMAGKAKGGKLKVFGWIARAHTTSGQAENIVAASSKAEAANLAARTGFPAARGSIQETGSDDAVAAAMARPGEVLWRDLYDYRGAYQPVPRRLAVPAAAPPAPPPPAPRSRSPHNLNTFSGVVAADWEDRIMRLERCIPGAIALLEQGRQLRDTVERERWIEAVDALPARFMDPLEG